MTKYFRDSAGKYIGGYDGVEPPTGSIEVQLPPDNANMRFNGGVWGYTLTEVKATKLVSITASRDNATTANVTAHTRQWQADERSQKLLSSAITMAMAGAPLPAAWRDVANSNMPITVIGELVAIAGAMAVQTQAAYIKSWKLKADVEAALTVEAVNAVVW